MIKNKKIIGILTLSATISIGAIACAKSVLQKDVTLIVEDNKQEIQTYTYDVAALLEEQNVKFDEDDIVSLELDKKLVDGDVINVINVEEKLITEIEEIEYTTDIVEDDSILKGETLVETKGEAGENELVYKLTYHNGKLVNKDLIEENVKIEVINEIVKKGTKVEEVEVATSRGESDRTNTTTNNTTNKVDKVETKPSTSTSKPETTKPSTSTSKPETTKPSTGDQVASSTMSVVSTAYSINGTTSTGTTTRWGVIAVDPKVIPYGTKVYIPEFGMTFIAEDTGGAIKGNKIDIYMPNVSDARQWGRRTIQIQILK